eukprot:2679479-Prymnesium_polylepis.1
MARPLAGGATPDSAFVWGSVTKLVTGVAILQLVDQHQLDLDAPIAPRLDPMLRKLGLGPMVQLFGAGAANITTEHLATMRSGVPARLRHRGEATK